MNSALPSLGWKTLTGAAVTVASGVLPLLHVTPNLVQLVFTVGLGLMGVGIRHAIAKDAALIQPYVEAAFQAVVKSDANAAVSTAAATKAAGHSEFAASVAGLAASALKQAVAKLEPASAPSGPDASAILAQNLAQFEGTAPGASGLPGAVMKPADVSPGAPSG